MNSLGLLRFPVLISAIALLMAGIVGGLARLHGPIAQFAGSIPVVGEPERATLHGGLMISGFLGTLIGLERAVALQRLWGYLGPLLTGLGSLALLLGCPPAHALGMITVGSLLLALVFLPFLARQLTFHQSCMTLGALLWAAGNALWWHGWPLVTVVPWWMGFLVLTIGGERLELSRLLQLSVAAYATLLCSLTLFVCGILVKSYGQYALAVLPSLGVGLMGVGDLLLGLGMFAVAAWLLYFDMARRALKQPGLHRYVAVALLGGYGWLGLSGGICLIAILHPAGPDVLVSGSVYDAVIHTFTLGFVMAMVLGHGPLVFPAVLGIPVTFTPFFYLPLALLNTGLIARVAGDLSGETVAQSWGGMVNAIALLLFILTVVASVLRGLRRQSQRNP